MNFGTPPPDSPTPGQYGYGRETQPQGEPPHRSFRAGTRAYTPYVTYTILGLTVLVYLAQMASQYILGEDWPALLGLKVNELILRGQYWRLFTPMLLHGSILHIAFNMYALNIFGPGLERHFGRWRFLALYLLGGFAGNVLSFIFSAAPSLGSSTAVFGLLGAEGVFLYRNRELIGQPAQRALTNLITVAAINLVIGISSRGIDNWGHIGGLLGGTLYAWLGGPLLRVEGIYPAVSVADERDTGDATRAALAVALVFGLLALGIIFLRGGIP